MQKTVSNINLHINKNVVKLENNLFMQAHMDNIVLTEDKNLKKKNVIVRFSWNLHF